MKGDNKNGAATVTVLGHCSLFSINAPDIKNLCFINDLIDVSTSKTLIKYENKRYLHICFPIKRK